MADTIEDSVSNATADLLMMAAWYWAMDTVDGEAIPVSTGFYIVPYSPLTYPYRHTILLAMTAFTKRS